jgi:hypothetical protein
MGVSVYYESADVGKKDSFPLAGKSEMGAIWYPIIRENELLLMDYAFSAGLLIDAEYYDDFLREVTVG